VHFDDTEREEYTRDHGGADEGESIFEEAKPTSPREDATNDGDVDT